MDFHIDRFQYFDQKIFLHQCVEKNFFDFTEVLKKRKANFPNHYFIVTKNNKIEMLDSYLFNFIKFDYSNKVLNISINAQINKPIYWIQIHNQKFSKVALCLAQGIEQTIIHEELVGEKSTSYLSVHNKGTLHYFNLVDSKTKQVFHKEIDTCNYGKTFSWFMQKESNAIVKVDSKTKLFEGASSNIEIFNLVQEKQTRDDCCEIQHIEPHTHSYVNYQTINNGKAVSQINSIIEKSSTDSELVQKIKHILTSDNAQSFSKPSLMIHAPTVASHGNTISSFPEEWLFYLYQKGITESKAKEIVKNSIVTSFCSNTPYESQFSAYLLGDSI